MTHEFIQLSGFAAAARRLGLTAEDVRLIELAILMGPEAWPVMAGTNGLRKMRFAPARQGGGKSGGIRVCYFLITQAGHVYLVTAYGKNERENLSAADRNAIAQAIAAIKQSYR